jgi:hypothetical protein
MGIGRVENAPALSAEPDGNNGAGKRVSSRDPALQAELAARHQEHEEEFYILVNEAQALDLASGYVPLVVRAMARTMVDWKDDLQRAAAHPVPKPKRRRRQTDQEAV